MHLAHKIEMKPTKTQVQKLICACGCARFAYNWGLNKWTQMYESYKQDNNLPKPNANIVKKEVNAIKETSFPWIYESPKDANQQAFTNLNSAFQRFYNKKAKYPKFKNKHNKNSFYISNYRIKVNEFIVTLPKIGKVKLTEKLRFEGKILNAIISKTANKWFISISVDTKIKYKKQKRNEVVGIDLGLTTFATFSNGEIAEAPKPLRKYQKQLIKKQRMLSRKKIGSNNRKKASILYAKMHYKIACIRNDFLHKLTNKICRENQTICLEDLQVKNMLKNHKLAKAISDVSWGEFNRQIQYKSLIYGNVVVYADKFYPSSKTCSNCGNKKKQLNLSERTFVCENCGLNLDRDLNASYNLSRLGYSRIEACGHETSVDSMLELASIVGEAGITQVEP